MKQYIKNIISEFKRVQWPSWDNLQNDSIVVAIASALIALIIAGMDYAFKSSVTTFYGLSGKNLLIGCVVIALVGFLFVLLFRWFDKK